MLSKAKQKDEGSNSDLAVVAMKDMRDMVSAEMFDKPKVGQITNSKQIHVGHKFVSITQKVENIEMVKGTILGLELVSPAKVNRRLRCSVAVFVCWAFLIAFGLGYYLFQLVTQPTFLDTGLNATWYLRRGDWQAMRDYGKDYLKLPLKNVVIGHTVSDYCNETYSCISNLMQVQRENEDRGFLDIVPNFLVSGNGFVFEGRGANVQAAMIKSWNVKSICIMFVGNYIKDEPDSLQFEHVNILLEQLVKIGVLVPDFVLYGHCQLAHRIVSPGPKLVKRLGELLHWNPVNKDECSEL